MRLYTWSAGSVALFVCVLLIFAGDSAHAYIDPGTGSYLLQFAIGAAFAAAFAIKAFWGKIRLALSHVLRRSHDGADQ
jgi:hypothetical protein